MQNPDFNHAKNTNNIHITCLILVGSHLHFRHSGLQNTPANHPPVSAACPSCPASSSNVLQYPRADLLPARRRKPGPMAILIALTQCKIDVRPARTLTFAALTRLPWNTDGRPVTKDRRNMPGQKLRSSKISGNSRGRRNRRPGKAQPANFPDARFKIRRRPHRGEPQNSRRWGRLIFSVPKLPPLIYTQREGARVAKESGTEMGKG